MDKGTIVGVIIAMGAILVGLTLEGGKVGQMLQPTAALIVFGGTLGAIMVQFPFEVVITAFLSLATIFFVPKSEPLGVIREIVAIAYKARREGIVSLDRDLDKVQNPFLRRSLMLAVDGTEPSELRKMMELELEKQGEYEENSPKVFESAGGFSHTIGIIGAILGLIQVMQHLDNITEVGKGIAVAFVATIYGVGSANIFFLPVAAKLKFKHRKRMIIKEMMLEGTLGILEGQNPRLIEGKLVSYLAEMPVPVREPEARAEQVVEAS